jgi:hypothetical protein
MEGGWNDPSPLFYTGIELSDTAKQSALFTPLSWPEPEREWI